MRRALASTEGHSSSLLRHRMITSVGYDPSSGASLFFRMLMRLSQNAGVQRANISIVSGEPLEFRMSALAESCPSLPPVRFPNRSSCGRQSTCSAKSTTRSLRHLSQPFLHQNRRSIRTLRVCSNTLIRESASWLRVPDCIDQHSHSVWVLCSSRS